MSTKVLYQRGVALVVSLLFLLIVTLISVTAATNSSLGLRMSGNMQDSYESFQAAEAGIYAALGLAGTLDDPFTSPQRGEVVTAFEGMTGAHPLRKLRGGVDSVDVRLSLIGEPDGTCPAGEMGEVHGTSTLVCDFFRVTSEHDEEKRARTRVEMGVVRMKIKSSNQ